MLTDTRFHFARGRLARAMLIAALAASGTAVAESADETREVEAAALVKASSLRTVAARVGELAAEIADLELSALGNDGRSARIAAEGPRWIEISTPGGDSLVVERTGTRAALGSGHAWIGRFIDGAPGTAVFLVRNGRVYGSIRRPGLNLQIRPQADGRHRLSVRDEGAWGEDREDFVPVWTDPQPLPDPGARAALRSSSPLVDVLVVYSEAARLGAGGTEAMEALIALGEHETNASYANGGAAQRIRVVHSEEVVYAETGNAGTDLSRLRAQGDGFLDDVHGLRDIYGADVVSLWLENTGCGIGYLMTTVGPGFAGFAFNVCRRTCATGNLTFGHELGHNMSLRHDWYVDDDTGPWTYNHGHVGIDADPGSSFRTVMAYADRCADSFGSSCTRLQHFSNPAVSIGGDPSGVPAGTSTACLEGVPPGTECDADNRLALDTTAATVAAFRPTQVVARLHKEVDVGFAEVGDTLTYTLTVTNDSNVSAPSVVLRDTVPAHTTLEPGSLSPDASTTGTAPGSVVTWNTGIDLSPGQSIVRTFAVNAFEAGIAVNTSTVDTTATPLSVSSNLVTTAIWGRAACGFQDGFESGALSHYWRVSTTNDGRVRVLPDLPDSGSFSAVLDDAINDGTVSQAGLELQADLAGQSAVRLDFRWAEAADENGTLDGVFVREAEGDAWVNVLSFVDAEDLVFQDASIDLAAAAAANSLALTDGFQIRFQFQDNVSFVPTFLAGSDGYAIDNVALACECSNELTDYTLDRALVEESACDLYVGPSYVVGNGGDLTVRSPSSVGFRNGFSVVGSGVLTAENGPVP